MTRRENFGDRNTDIRHGNTNNTKVQIIHINARAKVITFRNLATGDAHPLSRISFILSVRSKKRKAINFQIHRRQFPLRLAYAMTINKSQGQTLQRVALDLREPCFSHGQLYVALGRVPEPTRILVLSSAQYKNKNNSQHHTINVVHKRLLRYSQFRILDPRRSLHYPTAKSPPCLFGSQAPQVPFV